MVGALFDTNILIDHLSGMPRARKELQSFVRRAISIVTWAEILVGVDPGLEDRTRGFLRQFEVIGVDHAVAERAVDLRRARRIKLPDAFIWATAQTNALLLVTRNTKDFPADDPGVRVPYVVS